MPRTRAFLVPWLPLALALFAPAGVEAAPALRQALPPPVVDPHSTEICMNSRLSYHGGWTSAGTEQMLADVVHAAACAPAAGDLPVVYAATAEGVYIYDASAHSLALHRAGDWRSDASAAFEVGIAAGSAIDAGAAMHLAQLETVALWTGTASQLASCPRATATTYANNNWNPTEPIDIVISFGIRSVPGRTATLVAVSSDGSLPNPATDGTVYLDTVLPQLAYDATFTTEELSAAEISQVLWGAYGCSNHTAVGKAGLVCSSAVANYYLSRRVYAVGPAQVDRFHNRRPPGTDAATRDHRIELVRAGDTRPDLRAAVPGLPGASRYLVLCVGSTGAWQELEVGFAAIGAVLQAATLGLGGSLHASLTSGEQAAIRAATGIPAGDIPLAVVALGHPDDGADVGIPVEEEGGPLLLVGDLATPGTPVPIRYTLPRDGEVRLTIHDVQGRAVWHGPGGPQGQGAHSTAWDGRNDAGALVPSGVYFCVLRLDRAEKTARVVVIR